MFFKGHLLTSSWLLISFVPCYLSLGNQNEEEEEEGLNDLKKDGLCCASVQIITAGLIPNILHTAEVCINSNRRWMN